MERAMWSYIIIIQWIHTYDIAERSPRATRVPINRFGVIVEYWSELNLPLPSCHIKDYTINGGHAGERKTLNQQTLIVVGCLRRAFQRSIIYANVPLPFRSATDRSPRPGRSCARRSAEKDWGYVQILITAYTRTRTRTHTPRPRAYIYTFTECVSARKQLRNRGGRYSPRRRVCVAECASIPRHPCAKSYVSVPRCLLPCCIWYRITTRHWRNGADDRHRDSGSKNIDAVLVTVCRIVVCALQNFQFPRVPAAFAKCYTPCR